MGKKPLNDNDKRKKNVNVRITEDQYNRWEKYAEDNRFSSVSALVRYCVEEVVEGTITKNTSNDNQKERNNKIASLEGEFKAIKDQNKLILKVLAEKTKPEKQEIPFKEFQKEIIVNCLEVYGVQDEKAIGKLLKTLDEYEVLTLINELLEESRIKDTNKGYMVN